MHLLLQYRVYGDVFQGSVLGKGGSPGQLQYELLRTVQHYKDAYRARLRVTCSLECRSSHLLTALLHCRMTRYVAYKGGNSRRQLLSCLLHRQQGTVYAHLQTWRQQWRCGSAGQVHCDAAAATRTSRVLLVIYCHLLACWQKVEKTI